tara:strand:+ start:226 stop:2088 length:1863 start_codon:yes stop_codon:yes gene_type:complete
MKQESQEFAGLDGFLWFYGVVEDREDPYQIGRVKVRCFGHHTGNKIDLPTKDLPWAQVMLPVTSAGISGIGQTPLGLVEGSHVFGFFRDGEDRQEPVVMGSMPGYPAELADTEKGFYDPNGEYPRYINSPDTNQLATMQDYSFNPSLVEHASIVADNANVKNFQNIGTAVVEPMQLASAFISKGGGSFFGLVADIITSAVGQVIGANVLGSVGSTLNGFTESANQLVDSVSEGGTSFLKNNVGLSTSEIGQSAVNFSSTVAGKVRAQLEVPSLPSAEALTSAGLKQVGLTDTGQFKLDVINPASMQTLFEDAAETELLNNYNAAKERVDAGLGVVAGSVSTVIDPTVLGVRGALGTLETTEAQSSAIDGFNTQLQNIGGSAAQGSLITVTDKVTGVVTSTVEDIGQDSITAAKTVLGDQGISIPQKSTANIFGVAKLMNNFVGGNKDSWSMPTMPDVSDSYPKRHVYETESGHIKVYDDNENNRLIMERHASGTRYDIRDDGSKVDHIISDHIIGVEGTSYTNIKEDQIVTLNGRYKIYVNKDETRDNNYDIVVGKNANINLQVDKGDININVLDGRINANCSDNFNMIVGGDTNIITQGDYTVNAGGKVTMQGDKIFLN